MESTLALIAVRIGSALAVEAANGAGSLLWSEGSLLAEINESMRRVKREFEQIKALLNRMDRTQRNNNENMKAWLKEVRKIAYDAEDVIDEYTYLITEEYQHKFIGINCSVINKATNFRAWHRIAARLKQIEDDVANVHELRQKYGIEIVGSREDSSSNIVTPSSFDLKDDQIIGMVNEKKTLMGWMRDEVARENIIITVWGMGGSGKTTLVNSAYKNTEIQGHFNLKVWVTVSQTFQPVDILKRIYKSVASNDNKEAEHEIERMDFTSLVEKTKAFLRDGRFLIILDDVWDPNAYFELKSIFSTDPKPGSKIVITTRTKVVASLANEQRRMEHRTLRPDEAWDLFCNKAFWKDADRRCPREVEEWGRKIVDKCGGLALAIVAIARVMSLKEPSDWKQVYDTLSWEITNNSKFDSWKHILNLSYYDLPCYLKNCLLYCSIFPEDYEIRRTELVRLWIAEGFVETRGTQTVEDVAEDYCKELVHRCMLQAVLWNIHGKVSSCRMHDLIRELTITIARDENFNTVVPDSQTSSSSAVNEARRLSIHSGGYPEEISVDLSRIRSLIVFDARIPMSILSSKARYLRVLDLQFAYISKLPNTIGDLFNLHYLNLRYTDIQRLPNTIGRLRNLQTLDLRDIEQLQRLPRQTTKLKNLRKLTISSSVDLKNPKGLWKLTRLQKLQIHADEELVRRLGNLTLLRKLRINGVKQSYCPHLASSLSNLTVLNKLSISNVDNDRGAFLLNEPGRSLENVVKLNLKFRLKDSELSSLVDSLGDGFRELRLESSELIVDPLPQLSRLSNLIGLVLFDAYDKDRLCFNTGSFPNLKYLSLCRMSDLSDIIFEKGSLGSLKVLHLNTLDSLEQVPQGIEFQLSIEVLRIMSCKLLRAETMGTEHRRIAHILAITFYEERDGRMVEVIELHKAGTVYR